MHKVCHLFPSHNLCDGNKIESNHVMGGFPSHENCDEKDLISRSFWLSHHQSFAQNTRIELSTF